MTPAFFLGALTLILITLKLTGHILWAWWWVLSPIWITPIVFLSTVIVFETGKYLFLRKPWAKTYRNPWIKK